MIYIFGLTLTLYAFFTQATLAQDLAHDKISTTSLEKSVVHTKFQLEQGLELQDKYRPGDITDIEREYRANQERLRRSSLPITNTKVGDGQNIDDQPSTNFFAYATAYTRESSCHYRKIHNGREICPMASGKDVYVGAVACPRNLALGTKIKIDGTPYTCEDRYSNRLDTTRDLPTIDIFMLDNSTAIKFGKRKVYVEILK